MPLNNKPIFTGIPKIRTGRFTGGASGTGVYTIGSSNYQTIFNADPTNGSYLQKIRFKVMASTTVATVIKILQITGGSHRLYDEIYIPVTTLTTTNPGPVFEVPLNIVTKKDIHVGWTIDAGSGSYIDVIAIGGDFTENTA